MFCTLYGNLHRIYMKIVFKYNLRCTLQGVHDQIFLNNPQDSLVSLLLNSLQQNLAKWGSWLGDLSPSSLYFREPSLVAAPQGKSPIGHRSEIPKVYRVFQVSCNIKNQHISASKSSNQILKKVLKRSWSAIFACRIS